MEMKLYESAMTGLVFCLLALIVNLEHGANIVSVFLDNFGRREPGSNGGSIVPDTETPPLERRVDSLKIYLPVSIGVSDRYEPTGQRV